MAVNGESIVVSSKFDTTGFKIGIQTANQQFATFTRDVDSMSNKINISTSSILKGFGAIAGVNFGISGIRELANEVLRTTGLMQGLSLSFETMLGSKQKADELMMGIKEFALATPYTVEESATTVKQLIAMGAAGDNVLQTFKSLGDVAAGLNVPLQRIAINYGQVAALGKLQQREIRDFAMAGVPIYEALEDVLGRSRTEIVAMVTAGKVGFPAVEEAFRRLSGEGGRFNDMMSKLNSTVIGQLSRLKDQIQLMFADIGESNTGFIYGAIDGLSTLVSHYKEIINVVTSLATAYGLVWTAQKLSVSLNLGIQTSRYTAQIAELEKLVVAKQGNTNADLQQLVNEKKLTSSQAERIAALRAMILVEDELAVKRAQSNLATAESQLQRAQQSTQLINQEKIASAQLTVQKLQDDLKQIESDRAVTASELANSEARINSLRAEEIYAKRNAQGYTVGGDSTNNRIDAERIPYEINTETVNRNSIAKQLNKLRTDELNASKALSKAQSDLESISTDKVTSSLTVQNAQLRVKEAQQKLNTATTALNNKQTQIGIALQEGDIQVKKRATVVTAALGKAFTGLGKAIAASWPTLVITGIIMGISAIVRSVREANDARKEYEKGLIDEQNQVNKLVIELRNANLTEEERKSILEKLRQINPSIVAGIEDESNAISILNERLREYNILSVGNLAVSQTAGDLGFEKISEKLIKLKDELKVTEAEILNDYNIAVNRIIQLSSNNKISQDIQNQFNDIISSGLPTEDKLQSIYNLYAKTFAIGTDNANYLSAAMFNANESLSKYTVQNIRVTKQQELLNQITETLKKQILYLSDIINFASDTDKQAFINSGFKQYGIDVEEVANSIDHVGIKIQELAPTSESSLSDLIRKADEAAKEIEKLAPNDETLSRWQQLQTDIHNAIAAMNPDTAEYWSWVKGNASKALNLVEVSDPNFAIQEEIYNNALENEKRFGMNAIRERERQAREAEQAAERQKREKEKEIEDAKRLQEQLNDALLDLERDYQQSLIDLMQEGSEKQIAQIKLDNKRKIEEIINSENELIKAQGGNITLEQSGQFQVQIAAANAESQAEIDKINKDILDKEKETWNQYLINYGSYEKKKLAITEKYNKLIEDAVTPGEKLSLGEELKKSLQDLDSNILESISKAFSDLDTLTVNELYTLRDKLEDAWKTLDLSPEDFAKLRDQIFDITSEINERNPFKALSEAIKKYKLDRSNVNFKEIAESASASMDTIKAGFDSITNGVSEAGASFDESTQKAIKNVSGIIEGAGKLAAGIASGDIASIIDGGVKLVTNVIGVLSGAQQKRQDALKREIAYYNELSNVYQKLIQQQIELTKGLSGKDVSDAFSEGLKLINSQIITAQNELQAWFRTGASLGSHSYGNRYNSNFGGQLSQDQLFSMGAKEWDDFIKTQPELFARLPQQVRDYAQAIMDAGVSLEELKKAQQEALTGLTFDSLINSLSNLVSQSDMAFEDIEKSFSEHMTNAILQTVKNQFLQKELENWYNNFTLAMQDGSLSEKEASDLRSQYHRIATDANNLNRAALKAAGISLENAEDSIRSSASQGFAQASQDSIDRQFGVLINIENNVHLIREYLEGSNPNNQVQEATNIVLNSIYSQVMAIRINTDRLENIENYMRNTMNNTSDSYNELRKFNR